MRIKKLFITLLLIFVFSHFLFSVNSIPERDKENKTVRVGYMLIDNFQVGKEGEYKSGYGYEYLQLISNYTGWHYEYVYGTYNELFQKLVDGDIDLMGYVSYSEERKEKVKFTRLAQGRESIYIYTSPDSNITFSTTGRLPAGLSIGVGENIIHEKALRNWVDEQDDEYKIVKFQTNEELHKALEHGEIDSIISSDFSAEKHFMPILHLGFENFYFAVNKDRKDIHSELTYALNQIFSNTRYVNSTLYNKYYGRIRENTNLNHYDKKWLDKHNNTIRFGYLKDTAPYSEENKKGELKGVLAKLKEVFETEYNIKIETYSFTSLEEMIKAAKNYEIDIFGPLCADFYLSEINKIITTNSLVSTTIMLLHPEPELKDNNIKIGYAKNNDIQFVIAKMLYPDAELVAYKDTESCLKAVKRHDVDCTAISTAAINSYKQYDEFRSLFVTEINRDIHICLGIEEGRISLLNLTNRVITAAKDRLTGASFIENTTINKNLIDILKEHVLLETVVLLAIIIALLLFIIYYYHNYKTILNMKNANATLTEQAFRDELTKVGNRAAYLAKMDKLTELINKKICPRFAILVIDINGLKIVNDNFGHEIGDVLIKSASKAICSIFSHCPVYRIGGDEFVVLINDESYSDKDNLINELVSASTQELSKDAIVSGKFSISIGYSEYDKETDFYINEVFKRADMAMYLNKKETKKSLNIVI